MRNGSESESESAMDMASEDESGGSDRDHYGMNDDDGPLIK
jgi:hypothetical protein